MSKITSMNMRTSLRSPFNSKGISQNIPGHGVIRKAKKDAMKYFSRQAIRCEILAFIDARKSTVNPMHGSRSLTSSHYVASAPETKIQAVFTPKLEMSPNSYYASFHVISSLIICMTFFSLQYHFTSEAMAQFILYLSISINNFWLTLYASLVKVMLFLTHPALVLFKGLKKYRGNEHGLWPHNQATKTRKQRKTTLEKLERSCRLIIQDILYTVDATKIEDVCIGIGVAMALRVLYGLFFYVVHRFYSKKDRIK